MDDQMKIRRLNFQVTCLQNGLRIEKGQANVAYKENQDLKRQVDRLKTENLDMQSRINELCPPPSKEFQASLDTIPDIRL
jgi:hypothetical protein